MKKKIIENLKKYKIFAIIYNFELNFDFRLRRIIESWNFGEIGTTRPQQLIIVGITFEKLTTRLSWFVRVVAEILVPRQGRCDGKDGES